MSREGSACPRALQGHSSKAQGIALGPIVIIYFLVALQGQSCGDGAGHIHAQCSPSKTLPVAGLIEGVKKASSKWSKTKGGAYAKFHWQSAYGAFSVSPSQVAAV